VYALYFVTSVYQYTYIIFKVGVILNLFKFSFCNINRCSALCLDMQSILYCRSLYSKGTETFKNSSAQLATWTSPSGRVYSPRLCHNIVKEATLEKQEHRSKLKKTRKGNFRNSVHVYFYPIMLTL
jgi:hypothetical protein